VVEEAGVPGENHRPWASHRKLYHLRLQETEQRQTNQKNSTTKLNKNMSNTATTKKTLGEHSC